MGLGTGKFLFQLGAILLRSEFEKQQQAACDFNVDVKFEKKSLIFFSLVFRHSA